MSWRNEWTIDEKALVGALLERGYSAGEIADFMPGRTRSSIIAAVGRDPVLSRIGFARSKEQAA